MTKVLIPSTMFGGLEEEEEGNTRHSTMSRQSSHPPAGMVVILSVLFVHVPEVRVHLKQATCRDEHACGSQRNLYSLTIMKGAKPPTTLHLCWSVVRRSEMLLYVN